MPIGGLQENQAKPGRETTTIRNTDGEWVAWDAVEETCNVPPNRKQDTSFLTAAEASRKFKISVEAIYAKAKRQKWRLISHREKQKIMADQGKPDWGKRGEDHRELAFKVGHEAVKKFKRRVPKDFRELEIADKMARRAAGLENDSVIQQTLVHINEAVEGHAEAQVIEAYEVKPELPAP